MKLCDPVLIIDCQTTGMRPTSAQVVELAWCVWPGPVESRLIRLPDGEVLPQRICEITGLTEGDLQQGKSEEEVESSSLRGGLGIG